MRQVGAVLLAAGASTRLGTPKQLVRLGTENLLERSIRVAKEAALSPIAVILGFSAQSIRRSSNLDGVQVVLNHDWQEGMASSVRAGVETLYSVDGAIVMTCDMPAVTPSHLRELCGTGELTATSYAGRRGVPAYLPHSMFPTLMKLQGDTGARELLRSAPSIELPGGELDIDTEEDLRIAQRLFAQQLL